MDTNRLTALLVLTVTTAMVLPAAAQSPVLDQVLAEGTRAVAEGRVSQQRVETTHNRSEKLFEQYRSASKQVEGLKLFNNRLSKLVQVQRLEMEVTRKEIAYTAIIRRQIAPLMERMINALEEFIQLDMPFLQKERQNRIVFVRSALARPDVSPSEQLRQVLEAYSVESEYGRKLEAYRDTIALPSGENREVDILRVGRIALLYLTPDESNAGIFNSKTNQWGVLPGHFRNDVRKGVRIAKKQAAVDLMALPIMPAERVQ